MKRQDSWSSSTIRMGSAGTPMGSRESKAGASRPSLKKAGKHGLHHRLGRDRPPRPWQTVSVILAGRAERKAIALEHPVERAPVDAQHGRGAAHVAAALLQHLPDVAALQLRQ